ncbi:MAG: hypothetical protein MZW92_59415 [Comamonadaceae bacterium]|nr:hypothetical protein [Comamonadaceae bacterium]
MIAAAAAFVVTLHVTEFNPPAVEDLLVSHAPTSNIDPVELESGVTIKIMTWNIGYASLSETEDFVMDGGVKGRMDTRDEVEANITGIGDTLVDVAADIYFLQEVDEGSDRSYRDHAIYQLCRSSLAPDGIWHQLSLPVRAVPI